MVTGKQSGENSKLGFTIILLSIQLQQEDLLEGFRDPAGRFLQLSWLSGHGLHLQFYQERLLEHRSAEGYALHQQLLNRTLNLLQIFRYKNRSM